MLDARKTFHRFRNRRRVDAREPRDNHRGQHVFQVVRARERNFPGFHHRIFLAVMDDYNFVAAQARALAHALLPAEPEHLRFLRRVFRRSGIIRIQNRRIQLGLVLKYSRFCGRVCCHRLVPVQMVRRQIQQCPDVRPELFNQLQLKAAQFRDGYRSRIQHFHFRNQRRSHIACKIGTHRPGFQDVMNQRGRRGFAVRSRDANQLALQKPVRKFNFTPDRDALRFRQSQKRIVGRHAGAWDNQVLRKKRFFRMPAKFQSDSGRPQLRRRISQVTLSARFRCGHYRIVPGAK